jgi:hypothetical protein
LLIDASPRIVRKRELHDRLWPMGIVADATLVALVKQIRRALADHDARLIRTVHRVGYAFDGPIITEQRAPSSMPRWLIDKGRPIALIDGENTVGRDLQSHVWLEHATVSRRHARIVVSVDGALLEDLCSKNKTTLDGMPISAPARLSNGARIGFGHVFVTYREPVGGLATMTHLGTAAGAR